jgi:hypothetical protein
VFVARATAFIGRALVSALSRRNAVVNLAGEPLLGGCWTAARRAVLGASRIEVTKQLVSAIEAANPRPRVLVSGSAVGYYGGRARRAAANRCGAWPRRRPDCRGSLGTRSWTCRTPARIACTARQGSAPLPG